MANLILTNCNFLVPVDRVCFGTPKHIEEKLCADCVIYAERKPKHFLTKYPTQTVTKTAVVHQHAFAVTVEALR